MMEELSLSRLPQGGAAPGGGMFDKPKDGGLHIFNTNLERPNLPVLSDTARRGWYQFQQIGCAE